MSRSKTKKTTAQKSKRSYVIAPLVIDPGIPCPHCGERFGHHVTNVFPNGMRRRMCGKCGKPFPSKRA
jgi:hypothetical protein